MKRNPITLPLVLTPPCREKKRHKSAAYNQHRGHLLGLSGEGVDNGHDIIEHLVFTRREVEHAEEETAKAHSATEGCTTLCLACRK